MRTPVVSQIGVHGRGTEKLYQAPEDEKNSTTRHERSDAGAGSGESFI